MNLTKRKFFSVLRSERSASLCESTVAILILLILVLAGVLSGCNVTRTITTTAQTVQRGDTTTVIMTKTIETYDGNVDATKILQAVR